MCADTFAPVVTVRVSGRDLIVACCPFCGLRHTHGRGSPDDALDTRLSHCLHNPRTYLLQLADA